MTSTLLRQLSKELELLLWTRQLQKTRFNEYAALRFLSSAIGALRDAKTPELSPIGRYIIAQEGIYALCLGSIYLHGLLPTGQEGHRALVIHVACDLLELPARDRTRILSAAEHLQAITCNATESVEELTVENLVTLGDRALSQARYVFPDWFL